MIKISKRLLAIAKLVPDNSRLIDIGSDHALLDIYLYQTKSPVKIIISDIKKSALDNGIANLKKYHLEDKIEARLGNGLEVISKDEVDTIIISGMGAHTIVGMLLYSKNKLAGVTNLILQSNNDDYFLRQKIVTLGYYIDKEVLIKDKNIIYTIIYFKKGKRRYSKKELYFGPLLLKENSLLFQEKKKLELLKLQKILPIIPKKKYFYRYKIKKKISLYKD